MLIVYASYIIAFTILNTDLKLIGLIMNVQPQSIAGEVEDYMNTYAGMLKPNDIKLKRWLKGAESLRSTDPVESYLIESWVYRAQGKLNASLESAKRAYRLNGNTISNLATINIALGNFDEAENLCLEALKKDKTNAVAMHQLINNVTSTLNKERLQEALDIFEPINNRHDKLIALGEMTVGDLDVPLGFLNELEISIATYKNILKIGSTIKSKNYLGSSKLGLEIQRNEVGNFLIIIEKLYNLDIDDCLNLNEELFDSIVDAERPFNQFMNIVYSFKPLTTEEINNSKIGLEDLEQWV